MCSIVGSYSKEKFKELVKINQSRGSFSYSFLVLNPYTLETVSLTQNFGEFDPSTVDEAPDNMYYLGHTQAPTGGLVEDPERIHPAQIGDFFMFHNGIIKQKDVARLQNEYSTDEGWDSKLMLIDISMYGLMETVNTIDGSFACVFNDRQYVRLFRSAAGTLFTDDDLNISSTSFDSGNRIKKDMVFMVDFKNRKLIEEHDFKSKSSPYFY